METGEAGRRGWGGGVGVGGLRQRFEAFGGWRYAYCGSDSDAWYADRDAVEFGAAVYAWYCDAEYSDSWWAQVADYLAQ